MAIQIIKDDEFDKIDQDLSDKKVFYLKLVLFGQETKNNCANNPKKFQEIIGNQMGYWIIYNKEDDVSQFMASVLERFKNE